MLRFAPGPVSSSNRSHGVQQCRGRDGLRDQLTLEWISLAIIRIDEEAATKRDKVMEIRHRGAVNIWELHDEALAVWPAQLDRSRSGRGRSGRHGPILVALGVQLEIVTPDTNALQSCAFPTHRLGLITLDLALPTG